MSIFDYYEIYVWWEDIAVLFRKSLNLKIKTVFLDPEGKLVAWM